MVIRQRGLTDFDPEIVARFAELYAIYPKKRARLQALRAFARINPDEELLRQIIESVEAHKKTAQWQKGKPRGEYIPYLATFLNREDFMNEIEPEPECPHCNHSKYIHRETNGRRDWQRWCEVEQCRCVERKQFV